VVAISLFAATATVGNCVIVQGIWTALFSTIDWSLAARHVRRNIDIATQLYMTAADVKEPQD
jgi:hypothetical protein